MSDLHFCFTPKNTDIENIQLDLESKFNLVKYSTSSDFRNWIAFEDSISHFSDCIDYKKHPDFSLPDGSYSIWYGHPMKQPINPFTQTRKKYYFYIDPTDEMEWVILNCFYKVRAFNLCWYNDSLKYLNDDSIVKIKLSNIIGGKETFLQEILRIAEITGITINSENINKILELYAQWYQTTLKKEDFDAFKRQIGININLYT